MDDLIYLRNSLEEFINNANEEVASEKAQPYLIILEGVLKGLSAEIETE